MRNCYLIAYRLPDTLDEDITESRFQVIVVGPYRAGESNMEIEDTQMYEDDGCCVFNVKSSR